MLKSLGLWKSDFKDESPITEGVYVVKDSTAPADALKISRVPNEGVNGGSSAADGKQLVEVSNLQDGQDVYLQTVMKAS